MYDKKLDFGQTVAATMGAQMNVGSLLSFENRRPSILASKRDGSFLFILDGETWFFSFLQSVVAFTVQFFGDHEGLFLFQTYAILLCQLLVTLGFICLFVFW